MTSGIEGAGPYARLKELQREAKDCRYELDLINQGIERQCTTSTYQRKLKQIRAEIKTLNAEIKAPKDRP